ncbi:MAG TPA: PGPGW domain-containing protein [Thermoleophilaceae bacterium]|nr:PGPGW domain-containing protein [Thermoleophilaceae bacterium]
MTEESGKPQDDKPQMLVKLQERKERHKERHPIARAGVVVFGFLLVLVGIVLSGPGVPGPGFLVILLGLGFLALEFDRAERLLEKAIVFGDKLADRAEETTTAQRVMGGIAAALAIGAFVAAAILWDIPLLPV